MDALPLNAEVFTNLFVFFLSCIINLSLTIIMHAEYQYPKINKVDTEYLNH